MTVLNASLIASAIVLIMSLAISVIIHARFHGGHSRSGGDERACLGFYLSAFFEASIEILSSRNLASSGKITLAEEIRLCANIIAIFLSNYYLRGARRIASSLPIAWYQKVAEIFHRNARQCGIIT